MDHLPKTRKEAREKNSSFYFNGLPCPKGHISKRYTNNSTCRECEKIAQQDETHKQGRREYFRNWRKAHPNRGRATRKSDRMRLEYGLTVDQYSQILLNQNNCCAICRTPFKENGTHNEKAQIDHCHLTKKVRGLLCGYCNMGIGKLRDSVAIVESALNYLKINS
jgi:hypothetical protein